jgi:hypothetical protein
MPRWAVRRPPYCKVDDHDKSWGVGEAWPFEAPWRLLLAVMWLHSGYTTRTLNSGWSVDGHQRRGPVKIREGQLEAARPIDCAQFKTLPTARPRLVHCRRRPYSATKRARLPNGHDLESSGETAPRVSNCLEAGGL